MLIQDNEITESLRRLAADKGIPEQDIVSILIDVLEERLANLYHADIACKFEPKTADINLYRKFEVVTAKNDSDEITLPEAQKLDPNVQIGEFVLEDLKQTLSSIIKTIPKKETDTIVRLTKRTLVSIEKQREYNVLHTKLHTVVSGTIQSMRMGNAIVNLGLGEAYLPRYNMIPGETYTQGASVKAYVVDVTRDDNKPQVLLSRKKNELLYELLCEYVPEIQKDLVQIKGIARDPGSKAKILVDTNADHIDPVSTCIGRGGCRIQSIRQELCGERLDIVRWADEPTSLLINMFHFVSIDKILVHAENHFELVIEDQDFFKAIQNHNQNARLASRLLDARIQVISKTDETERKAKQVEEGIALFTQTLDLNETQAKVLCDNDICTLEQLVSVEPASIQSMFEDSVNTEQILSKAHQIVQQQQEATAAELECSIEMLQLPLAHEDIKLLVDTGIDTISKLLGADPSLLCDILNTSDVEQLLETAHEVQQESE